ncbi:hypothetical protein SANTM175S_02418 [Streptomyces antimycoticus]
MVVGGGGAEWVASTAAWIRRSTPSLASSRKNGGLIVLLGQEEPLADLPIGEPVADQHQDFPLARDSPASTSSLGSCGAVSPRRVLISRAVVAGSSID